MLTPFGEAHAAAGDIVAVRGKGFFSEGILRLTGNTVSHVGLLIAEQPVALVTEALWRVKTRPIEETIAPAEEAYLLQPQNVDLDTVRKIIRSATTFSADSYGWWDLGFQTLDIAFHTTVFSDHAPGLAQHPICSLLVAKAYGDAGLHFGRKEWESVTPADIYNYAIANHDKYNVVRIK